MHLLALRTGSGADMFFGAIQQRNAGDFFFANWWRNEESLLETLLLVIQV